VDTYTWQHSHHWLYIWSRTEFPEGGAGYTMDDISIDSNFRGMVMERTPGQKMVEEEKR
jgi:hypothetical protein